ncbi:MAG: cyclic-phosphate processing receiver domain-containing protein [Oscillospiraceae bacterium]
MKLFVDDTRDFPPGTNAARDYASAISMLKLNDIFKFDFVSLDYTLGDGYTGLDILKFMHLNKIYPHRINIHSNNVQGRQEMMSYIHEYFPESVILTANMLDK